MCIILAILNHTAVHINYSLIPSGLALLLGKIATTIGIA